MYTDLIFYDWERSSGSKCFYLIIYVCVCVVCVVCVCVCLCVFKKSDKNFICISMYVCMYVCMYMLIYTHMYMYIHTYVKICVSVCIKCIYIYLSVYAKKSVLPCSILEMSVILLGVTPSCHLSPSHFATDMMTRRRKDSSKILSLSWNFIFDRIALDHFFHRRNSFFKVYHSFCQLS